MAYNVAATGGWDLCCEDVRPAHVSHVRVAQSHGDGARIRKHVLQRGTRGDLLDAAPFNVHIQICSQ